MKLKQILQQPPFKQPLTAQLLHNIHPTNKAHKIFTRNRNDQYTYMVVETEYDQEVDLDCPCNTDVIIGATRIKFTKTCMLCGCQKVYNLN